MKMQVVAKMITKKWKTYDRDKEEERGRVAQVSEGKSVNKSVNKSVRGCYLSSVLIPQGMPSRVATAHEAHMRVYIHACHAISLPSDDSQ